MVNRQGRLPLLMLVASLLAGACAPIPPDARRLARAEHERQTAPPPPPPVAPPAGHHQAVSWPLGELAALDEPAVELRHDELTVAILSVPALKAMQAAAARLAVVVGAARPGLAPNFRVVEGFAANAYAIVTPEQPVIAANFGMVALLRDDEALWAALIGHELAHLTQGHQQKRVDRQERGEAASGVISVMLGFVGVPLAALLTDTAANIVNLGYSREDELAADALAVDYLRQAGYDPTAALRFHERLAKHSGARPGGLLSTHPGGAERVEAIRRQLEAAATR